MQKGIKENNSQSNTNDGVFCAFPPQQAICHPFEFDHNYGFSQLYLDLD
jgi:hypothetical protein